MKRAEAHEILPGRPETNSAAPRECREIHGGLEAGDFGGRDQKILQFRIQFDAYAIPGSRICQPLNPKKDIDFSTWPDRILPEMAEKNPQKGPKMDIHERIRRLRQERKWTQGELATKLGIQQKQISAYERGANNPSTEVLLKLATVFDVSLDYLAFDIDGQSSRVQVKDRELLRYFETIDAFGEADKKVVKDILGFVVKNHKAREELVS